VVTYDRRGRGASGNTPPYAAERESEDLQALVGELGGPVYALGFSSGAQFLVAQERCTLPPTGRAGHST
jgi:pimeloyl-ACP methyl ester carboxylesterase